MEELTEILEAAHLSYLPSREGGWQTRKEWRDVLSGGEKQRVSGFHVSWLLSFNIGNRWQWREYFITSPSLLFSMVSDFPLPFGPVKCLMANSRMHERRVK